MLAAAVPRCKRALVQCRHKCPAPHLTRSPIICRCHVDEQKMAETARVNVGQGATSFSVTVYCSWLHTDPRKVR